MENWKSLDDSIFSEMCTDMQGEVGSLRIVRLELEHIELLPASSINRSSRSFLPHTLLSLSAKSRKFFAVDEREKKGETISVQAKRMARGKILF